MLEGLHGRDSGEGEAVGRERQQTAASRRSVAKRVCSTEHTIAAHRCTHCSAEKIFKESNLIFKIQAKYQRI
jgi:hypothetical protein